MNAATDLGNIPGILTVTEVAARFRVSPATVRDWAKSGRLPAFRTPGGQWRFSAAAVEAFAANGTGQ